jgi:hypothetical protein
MRVYETGFHVMRYLSVVLVVLNVSPCLAGEQFRCGQWVVSEDISVAELIKKCGEPTRKTSNTEDVFATNLNGIRVPVGTTTTEVWTYDRGTRLLPMIVTIVDGELKRMSHEQ